MTILKLLPALAEEGWPEHSSSRTVAMGNSQASPVATTPELATLGSSELEAEQTRDFHFAVTWVTLFAHLDLIESTGPRRSVPNPSVPLALVPMGAAPLMEQGCPLVESSAAWEMVVPRMIRTDARMFIPLEETEGGG